MFYDEIPKNLSENLFLIEIAAIFVGDIGDIAEIPQPSGNPPGLRALRARLGGATPHQRWP